MTFLEHLEELRLHIIRSSLAIIVFAIIAFIFKSFIFDYILLAPKDPDFFTNRFLCRLGETLNLKNLCINSKPFDIYNILFSGQFKTAMMVAIFAGFILAAPVVFWEIWRFIAPALHEKERKNARGAVFVISALFFLGILFGFYIISPFSVHFLS